LLVSTLKAGKIFRLKLNAAGTAITDTFTIGQRVARAGIEISAYRPMD